jgi:hypothetical protein
MLQVECYAGHRGDEKPRRLTIDDRQVFVEEIIDTWTGPDHRYFKVKGDDGDLYIIRQDTSSGAWELTMFRRDK